MEAGHAHLSNTPAPIDGAFGHPSLQRRKTKSANCAKKNTIFLVFMNKTQISVFALALRSTSGRSRVVVAIVALPFVRRALAWVCGSGWRLRFGDGSVVSGSSSHAVVVSLLGHLACCRACVGVSR